MRIYIKKRPTGYKGYAISSDRDPKTQEFWGYTKREALQLYKEKNGLKYKRGVFIYDYTT